MTQGRDAQARAGSRSWPDTVGRLLMAWVAIAAVVVAWGWLLTQHLEPSLGELDDDLARAIAERRTPGLTDAAEVGATLGITLVGAAVVGVAALVFAVWRRTWLPLVFVALVEAGLGGIYWLGTTLDERDRPPVRILEKGLVPDHSFPSGHTATSVAVFLCLALLLWTYTRVPRGWVLLLAVVPLACLLSRLYQGAHHLTDVLTSVVYAGVWTAVVARLVLGRSRQEVEAPASVSA